MIEVINSSGEAQSFGPVYIFDVNGKLKFVGGGGPGGPAEWGHIIGTLSDQLDLQAALDAKVTKNLAITGATKTKITYDSKGLVTAGADAGISDITGLQTALDAKFDLEDINPICKLGENINKGQAVYISSANGTNMIISKASNNAELTSSKTFGLLSASGVTNNFVRVITSGFLAGLDTSAASAAGDPVWLGTNGDLLYGIANKPYAPSHLVFIGIVTKKNNSTGEIYIKVQNGFELDELHDVSARSASNNDGIFYNTSTSLWEHKSIATALGYTPANDSLVVHLAGGETITGTKTFTTNQIVEVTTTDAALRVTQLGTGEAIRVEDSTNPDSTPFIIDATGKVGIGTSSPSYFLSALSTTATDTIMHFDGGTAANANLIAAADTTIKIPSIVLTDRNNVYGINTSFYLGIDRASGPQYAGRNDVILVQNFQDKGFYFVTNNGGSKAVRLAITGTGAVGIGTGTTAPAASSLLEMSSTTKGILIPRMTTTQRNAISSPATGLLVYDTTLNSFYFYNGSAWTVVGGGSGTVTSIATTSPILGGTITSTGTISIQQADASKDGYISMVDWNKFNGKQEALVSGSNIKTVNSTSLLGSGDVVVPAGMNWMGAFPG